MSVPLILLDSMNPVRVAALAHLSARDQSTVGEIFREVVRPKDWRASRYRVDKDVKKLVRLGFAEAVMIGQRRKAYKITELGRKQLRIVVNFYRSV